MQRYIDKHDFYGDGGDGTASEAATNHNDKDAADDKGGDLK